jgi:hypothetical protein
VTKMNLFDIVPPDFKLTGIVKFTIEKDGLVIQRKRIQHGYQSEISPTSPFTVSMQLNKPIDYWEKLIPSIPIAERELFIATLGRKEYYDEVLLFLALNTKDEYTEVGDGEPIKKQRKVSTTASRPMELTFTEYLKRLNSLYQRLTTIVDGVMKLTAGSRGSRRPIYQHYFYSKNSTPARGDAILSRLIGTQITPLSQANFKQSLITLRKELNSLYAVEDVPVIDLIDLSLDQFNTLLKLLPKDNAWVTLRKQRYNFFSNITSDLEKLDELAQKFTTLKKRYDNLSQKRGTASVDELQALSEMVNKDTLNTLQQKIKAMASSVNAFTLTYNSSGILKYRGKTLKQSSSLINDLLNSQFMVFLQTFKAQHKQMLTNAIKQKLSPQDDG